MNRVLLLLLLFPAGAFAQTAQLDFERASEELSGAQYSTAIARLQSIEQAGFLSGPLFLNLAIAYTALDSLGMAKYYYLQATAFNDTRSQAEKGLQFIENRFRYRTAKLPPLPWERFFQWLKSTVGEWTLWLSGVVLLNLTAVYLAFSWFFPALKRRLIWVISAGVLGSVFLVGAAFKIHYNNARYAEAVQIATEQKILSQPDEAGLLVSNSFEGYTFTVDFKKRAANPDWLYVRMSNGLYGWIPAKALKILN